MSYTKKLVSKEKDTLSNPEYYSLGGYQEHVNRLVAEYGPDATIRKRGYNYDDGEYLAIMVACKDAKGNYYRIPREEFDSRSDLVGINSGNEEAGRKISMKAKGLVLCKDIRGNTYRISKEEFDKRKNIDLFGITKRIP